MARIVFYCHDTMENILSMEYYRQDIEALRALGHDVVIANRYRDIPWRFDALFIWWWTYALLPVLIARVTGRTAIVTGTYNFRFEDQVTGVDYFARPWRQRLLISLATRLASANIFVGRKEYEAVPAHFGLERSYYAPHAVPDAYFAAGRREVARTLLSNLAWSGAANLKRKGVWTILDAAALLKQRGHTFELVLAGKRGDAFDALQQRIVDLDLSNDVKAIGEVSEDEKLDLFARTRLYLQPSYFEGFGLASAEAMAAGCCVVTTAAGEVPNVVGDSAVYVQPGDADGLARAIEDLLLNPARIGELSARGTERIRRLFSFDEKRAGLSKILVSLGMPSSPS